VIVNNLNVLSRAALPLEAQPPLVVDANTVSAIPISFKFLKPITRWRPEELQRFSSVKLDKLAHCYVGDWSKTTAFSRLNNALVSAQWNVLIMIAYYPIASREASRKWDTFMLSVMSRR